MEILTNVITEIFKMFYFTFWTVYTFIGSLIHKIFKISDCSMPIYIFKNKNIYVFIIVSLCMPLGLFATNYYFRDIAILIPGGLLLYEFFITITFIRCDFIKKGGINKEKTIRFIDFVICKNEDVFTNLKVEDNVKWVNFTECLYYVIIFGLFNLFMSNDRILVILVLALISLKTSLKYLEDSKSLIFRLSKEDGYYLIVCGILFILSSFYKFIRDILVHIITAVFYTFVSSIIIFYIKYENKEKNIIEKMIKKGIFDVSNFELQKILLGLFICYFVTSLLTWRLFWKKRYIIINK
ncbi:hypothetical protein A0H76_2160 [Hepatospora eriocheir]|uniref:Uncharacterized protein n=1 Tax=Hepatospora eriocheir TaxID=1081669 RepID=A0A1X0QFT0_9MICR|nr:hypothetical protein A0H76_2160 [Hepatospora eriocheir]